MNLSNLGGKFPLFALSFALLSLAHPGHADETSLASNDTVLQWNSVMLEAVSRAGAGPTPVSRSLGIVSTSMYDAWAAYDETAVGTMLGDSLQVAASQNTQAKKQEAISFAAYRALVDLYPSEQALFDGLMEDLGYDPLNTTTDLSSAAGVGNVVSQLLLSDRHQDGSNQQDNYRSTYNYSPENSWDSIRKPDYWQPISLDGGATVQSFLTPHWGDITPFALSSGDQFLPPPPQPFRLGDGSVNPEYVAQTLQVLEYSAELTDREKVMAEYWADGPQTVLPPGHWHMFAQHVSQRDNLSLDENVQLLFALGNAQLDAGIAAWKAKVVYDYVRPITAIQYLAEHNMLPEEHEYVRRTAEGETEIYVWGGPNRGSQWILGSEWLPYQDISFVTPPFGEYVSGHSTFSSAGASILRQFTGSDDFGLCHTERANSSTFEDITPYSDIDLCWDTFSAAADEAGLSRLYGGIHFNDGDIEGRILGNAVGQAVWDKTQFYINGGKQASVPEPGMLLGLGAIATGVLHRSRRQS